jgi:hypothetical protein
VTGSSPFAGSGAARGTPPATLLAAVVLTGAAGLSLVAYGIFLAVQWLTKPPERPVGAALLVVLSVGWGLGVLACAVGLLRRRRWAVAPAVTSALLLVTVGWLVAGSGGVGTVLGWVLVALASGCLATAVGAARHLD